MAEPMVEIKLDEAKLERIRKMLREIPREMPGVMSRSINRTTTSSRAEIVRRIAKEIKLTQTIIRKTITIKKATRQRWQAIINLFGKRIPLIKFGARQIKSGISYKISRTGGRKKITDEPRPFIQTMPSGHIGVFRRKRAKRYPIQQLFGPSVGGVFEGAAGIAKEIQLSSREKLEKNIDAQIKYVLSKRMAG